MWNNDLAAPSDEPAPRILHVVGLKNVGGVECIFSEYMQSLGCERRLESVLVTKTIHPFFAPAVTAGAAVVAREKYFGFLKLPRPLKGLRRLNVARIFDRAAPDVVLAWSAVPSGFWTEFSRRRGTPVIYYDHGMSWHVRHKADIDALNSADAVITVSHAAARVMQLRLGYKRPVRVVPNGLRTAAAPKALMPGGRALQGSLRVGFAGRLVPMKGTAVLLHAIAQLATEGRPVELHLAGQGTELERLKQLTRRLGIERITFFRGLVKDIGAFYRAIDVLVCPALRESFGLVSIEAAAHGCPVLVARVDGLPETLVDGITGICLNANLSMTAYVELGGNAEDIPEVVYDPDTDRLRSPQAVDPTLIARQLALLQDDPARYRQMSLAAWAHANTEFRFETYVQRLQGAVHDYLATGWRNTAL